MRPWTRQLAITLLSAVFFIPITPPGRAQSDPLTIISPATDWVSLPSEPIEVKVRITGASALGLRVKLNGADITHLFGPPAGGVLRALIPAAHLKHGVNHLEARLGAHRAWRSFRVRSLQATLPGPAPQSSPPLLVPIQTRAISGDGTKATDYGIWVGETLYTAPALSDGSATGYQVLLLDRLTLELVSNQSFPTSTSNDVSNMANAMSGTQFPKGCGEFGCLMAVQSLAEVGYTHCVGQPGNCYGLPGSLFENLGGSPQINYANGGTPNTGYSLIANVAPGSTARAGSGVERLTCNYANNCGDLTNAGGRGAISGVLIKDNYLAYTFAYSGRATFSTGTATSPTGNTITIGGTPNGGAYSSATIPAGSGAFQVLVIYGDSLQLVSNDTFDFDHLYSDDPSVRTMAQVLGWAAGDENSLVFISSVGTNMWHNNWLFQWSKVAQAVASLGGTYSVFMSIGPGDDYSLVGRGSPYLNTGLYPFSGAVEASTVVSNAIKPVTQPAQASNLRGVMVLDNRGYYAPTLSNLTSTFDQSTLSLVDAVALQPPTPWPATDTPGQQAAYAWISYQLINNSGCYNPPQNGQGDIRSNYTNDNSVPAAWLSDLNCLQYTSGQGFTQDDFNSVKAQLGREFNYVATTRQYLQNITDLYTQIATGQDAILNGAYQAVAKSLQPDGGSKLSPKWQAVISGSATISGDLAAVAGGPPAKLALDSVFVMSNISMAFANDSGGNPLQGAETKFNELQEKSVNDFAASLTNIGNLFDLILTDWGRLQTLGEPLLKGCNAGNTQYNSICWDSNLNGIVLDSLDRALRREYLTQLMASAYEMGLWTNVSEGHGPPKLHTLCSRTQYSVCISDGEGNVVCDCVCDTTSSDAENWLALPSGPTAKPPGPDYDGQYYDIWLFGSDVRCSSNNNRGLLSPLFAPLDPNDPTQLGVYKPYYFLYLRGSIHLRRNEKCTRGAGSC